MAVWGFYQTIILCIFQYENFGFMALTISAVPTLVCDGLLQMPTAMTQHS